jgi:hypothetical protein
MATNSLMATNSSLTPITRYLNTRHLNTRHLNTRRMI